MKHQRLGLLCLTVMLGGCAAVGPNYTRPTLEAPAQWTENRDAAAEETDVALAQAAWWKSLNDPVLDRLMVEAVKGNLDVERARARIMQARANLAAAGAAMYPAATASGSSARSKNSENTDYVETSTSPFTLNTLGFETSWEIDVFGGIRRNIEANRAKVDASIEDLHATMLTLLGDVAKYYVELRSSQAQLEITGSNLATQRNTVGVTRERHRLGLTTYLDVAQAETQKHTTQSNIPTTEASIKESIHRLGILLGKEPNALKAELSVTKSLPKADGVMAVGLPSELLIRRPDLRQAERELAAASADIGVATADLYPKFDLTFGMGLSSLTASKFLALSSGYWSLVPEVSMLLFDGGKTRAKITGKQAVYQETMAAYRSSFLKALEEVENALTAWSKEQVKYGYLADAVRSSEEAAAIAEERYRRGLINFLDVLEAQRTLYNAQSSLKKSEAAILTNLITLYKALGGGWDAAEVRVTTAEPVPGRNL